MRIFVRQSIATVGLSAILVCSGAGAYAGHHSGKTSPTSFTTNTQRDRGRPSLTRSHPSRKMTYPRTLAG